MFARPLACIATIIALALASTSLAGNPNPGVLPPNSKPYGHTYSEWAAAWWQWALETPADQNPVTDETGEFCDVNQQGRVWFLAGNFGGTTVRTCTVPLGKALFIPLANTAWIQFPEDPPFSVEELREIIRPFWDDALLTCEIDGVSLRNLDGYREDSAVFDVDFPEGNVYGLDPGNYSPCVDNGYYLMLAPLKRGQHTIHFTAQASGGFSLDVTYHLTVE